MSFMAKVGSFFASGIIDDIGAVADRFIQTQDEKSKFMLEVERTLQKRESEIEQTIRTELQAKSDIIVAELKQDDKYTKRARPSIIYLFLFFVTFNYCLVPLVQMLMGFTIAPFVVPDELWYLFGTVLSTYSLGRSIEKTGFRNKVTTAITGETEQPAPAPAKRFIDKLLD